MERLKAKMKEKIADIIKTNQKYWKEDKTENAKSDSLGFFYEVVGRLIVEGCKNLKDLSMFTVKEIAIINSFVSKSNKTLLIMDDMTSELQSMSSAKNKVNYNGNFVSVKDAFNNLFIDIFTRARHYNLMVCMFVHNIDFGIDKSFFTNVILLGDNVAQKVLNARLFTDELKAIIRATKDAIFNNPNLKYYFLVINASTNDFCCSISDLHIGEELKLTSENEKLVECYKKVLSSVNH